MSVSLVHCFPPLQSISLERYFHLELSGVLPAALIFLLPQCHPGAYLCQALRALVCLNCFR